MCEGGGEGVGGGGERSHEQCGTRLHFNRGVSRASEIFVVRVVLVGRGVLWRVASASCTFVPQNMGSARNDSNFRHQLSSSRMSIASQTFCPNAPLQPNGSLPWIIEPPLARSLSKAWRCPSSDAFARELVPWAKAKHPKCKGMASCFTPISNYRCYAVLLGETGSIYLGLNVEIPARPKRPRCTPSSLRHFSLLVLVEVARG